MGVRFCKQVNAVNLVYDCKMAFFWFAYAFVFGNLLGEENDNLSILNNNITLLTENTESCSYGEPRLFKQAQTQYYGMLQICNNSSQVWEAVCDYSWSCSESIVACKQLGNTNPCKHRYIIFTNHAVLLKLN